MGGAMFLYGSRVIAIDPQWPFKDNEVLLTMGARIRARARTCPIGMGTSYREAIVVIRRSHRGRQRWILAT